MIMILFAFNMKSSMSDPQGDPDLLPIVRPIKFNEANQSDNFRNLSKKKLLANFIKQTVQGRLTWVLHTVHKNCLFFVVTFIKLHLD